MNVNFPQTEPSAFSDRRQNLLNHPKRINRSEYTSYEGQRKPNDILSSQTSLQKKLQFENPQPSNLAYRTSPNNVRKELTEQTAFPNPDSNVRVKVRQVHPMNTEENMYREKYYETLRGGFNKNKGYFTEFASKNKLTEDQYRVNRKLLQHGHSRYVSKPVVFTALTTKNILADVKEFEPSQLLESKLSSTWKNNFKSDNCSPIPFFPSLDNTQILDKSQFQSHDGTPMAMINKSPKKKRQESFSHSQKLGDTVLEGSMKTPDHFRDLKVSASLTGKALTNSSLGRMFTSVSPSKVSLNKNEPKSHDIDSSKGFSEIDNSKVFHDMSRYQTRRVADTVRSKYSQRSKIDPNRYLQHVDGTDYLRESNIAFTMANKDHRSFRSYPGSPTAYTMRPPHKHFNEPDSTEAIGKFEENLLGWAKSVPNFGKQRWTYDKSWEFRLI